MSLFNFINPYHLNESVRKKEPLEIQREIILQFLLIAVSVWGVIGLTYYLVVHRLSPGNQTFVVLISVLIAIQILSALFRRLPFQIRAMGLAAFILFLSFVSLFREGLSGTGVLSAIAFAAIVALLFGSRTGYITTGALVVVQALVGWAMVSGRIALPDVSVMANSGVASSWIFSILAVLFIAGSITAAFSQLSRALITALREQKTQTVNLEKERDLLETRVDIRTKELMRKAAQMEAAHRVTAALANEADINHLLTTAVDVMKDQFGFYHAGIFLNDPQNISTVLKASTGLAGQKMLEKGHQLRIGEEGIVGKVASGGEPRVAGDVFEDPNYYSNPLLPETRAEMAVPLRSNDKTIGVLDIQSTVRDSFNPDDVEVITTLANQLSQAMDKARLVQELQTSLAELEANVRQNTAKTWNVHLRGSRRHYAFEYKHAQVQASAGSVTTESGQALQSGVTVISQAKENQQAETTIAVPIKLRNQTLGVVNMRVSSAKVSPEMVSLVENAVNRLAVSLESVRLLEELQVRAERERLVGEVSSKVRSATDVETILRTAANEIGRSLGVSEVVVQLNTMK